MHAHLEFRSDSGLALLADREHVPSTELQLAADRAPLRRLAEDGKIFFLDAEDPADFRIDLYVGEEPDLPQHCYQQAGGNFLLRLPSGQLTVVDGTELSVEPGPYLLTLFERAVVDAQKIEQERRAVLTAEQWRYRQRIERFAAVGCLLFVAAWVVVFIYQFSRVSLAALTIALLAAAPSYLLTKTRRYQETERLLAEHNRSQPQHVLVLRSVGDASELSGGCFVA